MISKELVAASSEAMILAILAKGENYGYDIIRLVRQSSGERIRWSDGMLYPVLHRLEKRGLIQSTWQTAETGRRRKYYRLTTKGSIALKDEKEQWETVHSTLSSLWAS
ncbi:MAG: helix-turn-helix transcriptional regulator [Verrucomicrobiota bacterium]